MDVMQLIERMAGLLDDASGVPFSSKVLVNADEFYGLLNEIKVSLPDEIKQATWIKEERHRILSEAEEEASNIVQSAQERLNELVSEHEVTKAAETRAREIISQANQSSKEIKDGTLEYADNMLLATQENLKSLINQLSENRSQLRQNNREDNSTEDK